jgi:hypothetical protein
VPGRASGPSRSLGRWRRRIAMCSGEVIGSLDFSRRGIFIGEEAASEVDQGAHTTRGCGLALGHATLWCGHPLARLRLLFGILEAP